MPVWVWGRACRNKKAAREPMPAAAPYGAALARAAPGSHFHYIRFFSFEGFVNVVNMAVSDLLNFVG